MSLAEAAFWARVMVANGLSLEPMFESTPFVATNQVAEKTDMVCKRRKSPAKIKVTRLWRGSCGMDFFGSIENVQ
jgi:hypothetical protein